MALGLEDGSARIYDAETGKEVRHIAAHDKRVKGLEAVPSPLDDNAHWLVTISSDGTVKACAGTGPGVGGAGAEGSIPLCRFGTSAPLTARTTPNALPGMFARTTMPVRTV